MRSPNPAGRKPSSAGPTIAAMVRDRLPAERIADMLLELATKAENEQTRLSALSVALERGYGKVPSQHELTLNAQHGEADADLSALTTAQLAELDALEQRREQILADGALTAGAEQDAGRQPAVLDTQAIETARQSPTVQQGERSTAVVADSDIEQLRDSGTSPTTGAR